MLEIVKAELLEMKQRFGTKRPQIESVDGEYIEDLIAEEQCVYTLTEAGSTAVS